MDFFDQQEAARRATRKLIVLFGLAVAGVVLAVYAIFAFMVIPPHGYEGTPKDYVKEMLFWSKSAETSEPEIIYKQRLFERRWWDLGLFLPVAAGTTLVVLLGSAVRSSQLAEGGRSVASMLGGRLLPPNTTDPCEQRLLNVVEEMSLACGMPVPPVYLLDEESGVNAFAAGVGPNDAVIGMTRGCIRLLSRDELQGVIAHEFSHILNGDMRLNMRLMGLVFGITMIATLGQAMLRLMVSVGPEPKDSDPEKFQWPGLGHLGLFFPLLLAGGMLTAVGWIGEVFGRLIRSAISRQREFLADAASAQFTRNPGSVASALKKIGGLAQGSRLRAARAAEAGHFYFSNGLHEAWFGAFATHPSLGERIGRLEPGFEGMFPDVQLPHEERAQPSLSKVGRTEALARLVRSGNASEFVAKVGTLTADRMNYVEAMRCRLPKGLAEAAREPVGASAAVFGMLLSSDGAVCSRQMQLLQARVAPAQFEETGRLLPNVRGLPPEMLLPLADVAVQALRQLSPAQFDAFCATIDELVRADEQIDLFEFALQRLLRVHLEPHFRTVARSEVRFRTWGPVLPDALLVVSALAHAGAGGDAALAEAAFLKGAEQLEVPARADWSVATPEECCDLTRIDLALERLREVAPWLKKNFLFAAATTVMANREVSVQERELLRAIADSLDCPVPPFAMG